MPGSLLASVLGQPAAIATLRRALATGRVPHAYLFEGPDGVGKELAAFGLAQALVCSTRDASSRVDQNRQVGNEACGTCSACKRAVVREETQRTAHPDVIVLARGLYEPVQIGRRTPETQDISIDQVRTLVLSRASFPPHEGRAKVFIVRRAEELSTSATNALLKTLEEPGRDTHFILLTSQRDALLPTIRSRTQRVRFAPLPTEIVQKLLEHDGIEPAKALAIAKLAGGSIELGRGLADPTESEERESFVARAMQAISAPTLGPALDLAEEAKKNKERLGVQLAALASHLADNSKALVSAADARADAAAARYQLVILATRQLETNASPQMLVESMFIAMRGL